MSFSDLQQDTLKFSYCVSGVTAVQFKMLFQISKSVNCVTMQLFKQTV